MFVRIWLEFGVIVIVIVVVVVVAVLRSEEVRFADGTVKRTPPRVPAS